MYLYIKNGYMVTLLDFVNAVNGFGCNQHGYKWLHWLHQKFGYNKSARQGSYSTRSDPFLVIFYSLIQD